MVKEIQPKDSTREAAYKLWMKAPNPMVTFFKTLDVTNLIKLSNKSHMKFNMLLDYCIGKAAVNVKEFYILSGLGNSEPLKNQCFRALFFFFYLNFYSFFCIFFSKISLTYLPVCAACFVALPGLKARPLIDNIFPFHISIKGGSAHVKALAVSSGIFTLPA